MISLLAFSAWGRLILTFQRHMGKGFFVHVVLEHKHSFLDKNGPTVEKYGGSYFIFPWLLKHRLFLPPSFAVCVWLTGST